MAESVALIFPWRGGCEHRERAFAWLRAAYPGQIPDWDLVTAEAPPGPWIKAAAVNPALEACDAEIVIVHDADVWCEGLPEAVEAVKAGAAWAVPHRVVHRLTEDSTAAVFTGADNPWKLETVQPTYVGLYGGGIVVARREVIQAIPLDPRFVGWGLPGQEDESWATALRCLAGKQWRGKAPLLHLWHPPQDRANRRQGSVASMRLRRRYAAARLDRDQMRSLIEEARNFDAHPTDQPALHAPAA